jgi:hypothetical protein
MAMARQSQPGLGVGRTQADGPGWHKVQLLAQDMQDIEQAIVASVDGSLETAQA